MLTQWVYTAGMDPEFVQTLHLPEPTEISALRLLSGEE